MFIIKYQIEKHNYTDELRCFVGYNQQEKSELEKIAQELNSSTTTTYEVVEYKDQFLCEFCHKIYYDKHRSREECECGALICEFCENAGNCACGELDFE